MKPIEHYKRCTICGATRYLDYNVNVLPCSAVDCGNPLHDWDCERYTIANMVIDAHNIANEKGWHPNKNREADQVGAAIALMHSELSEALESFRETGDVTHEWKSENYKPEGVSAELADVVIRIADFCGLHDIDLARAIVEKMAFNRTRTNRHGGKHL